MTDKPPQQAENGASSNNNVVPFRQGARTPPPHHTSGSSARDRSSAVASPPKHVPDSSSSSSCPFLQALQQPPHVKLAWWERVQQITAPMQMQSAVLDQTLAEGGSMVQLEQHLAFEVAYVPGTGSAVRSVLAGDSGSDPFTGPSLVPFFGEDDCASHGECVAASRKSASVLLPNRTFSLHLPGQAGLLAGQAGWCQPVGC